MPTRVLLEGPAIEPLLAQVREEYGSSVRIISADKVRSGGFGGFFAKQRYELSVEVPDEEPDQIVESPLAAARRRAASLPAESDDGPPTLEQLLARAESNDRIAGSNGNLGIDAGRRPSRAIDSDSFVRDPDRNDPEAMPGGPTNGPGSSSTDHTFANLMAGLDSAGAAAAARAAATEAEQDRPTVRPFRPSPAQSSSITAALSPPPAPSVPSLAELMGGLGLEDLIPPVDSPATTNGAESTDTVTAAPNPKLTRLQRTAAQAYGQTPVSVQPAIASASSAAPPMAPSQGMPDRVTMAHPAPAEAPTMPPTTELAATELATAELAAAELAATDLVSANPATQAPADPVAANLMRVGMPAALADMIKGADTYAGVLTALASRPAAPAVPDAAGEVLVLAGELSHAVPIARQIVEQVGLEQTHLLLAGSSAAGTGVHSSRVISGPAEAEKRAEKLQSADAAWIVVLDAPVGSTDPAWVRDTCAALGATAVWAVVDATRKTADTARHLGALGEVEALVVHGVDVTSDPASVLGLDLPIVSLDGKPATPHAWAAMLCARIASDVAPAAPPVRRSAKRGR